MHPCAWASRSRLQRWKNRYKNQKAVILCNGPSLNQVDFHLLLRKKIFCFGLNKINLIFPQTEFRPAAIVAVNFHVINQNVDFFNKTEIPLFLDFRGHGIVTFRNNVHFLHSVRQHRKFATDCSVSVIEGSTVTFVAMQLAFHMGFQMVALVGCDHSFSQKGPANETVIAGNVDPDHFDSRYFSEGAKWQLPDLLASELHYDTAKEAFAQNEREIVNCTVGGKLEIFRRMHLKDFLQA